MRIDYDVLHIRVKRPFAISRDVTIEKDTVIVWIEHDGLVGFGEAIPYPYYGDHIEAVKGFLDIAIPIIQSEFVDPFDTRRIETRLHEIAGRNFPAKAGIMDALYDLIGKMLNIPVWKLIGVPSEPIKTSYTIGLGEIDEMIDDMQNHCDFEVFKIKLGRPNDYDIIKAMRDATNKPIRVDANAAWDAKEALKKIEFMAELGGFEFVEQPLHPNDFQGLKFLKERSPLPIVVDESVLTSADIPRLLGYTDGINIKLAKSGGIPEAIRMIEIARAHNLKVMLGCMVETGLGVAAAAQIAPLVDYVDLDGNILLAEDPFVGLPVKDGYIHLTDKPGLGVEPKQNAQEVQNEQL